ncbi:hypothetical protein BDBG_18097, partial [Blastomyces gilchristii SLH14081]
SSCVDRSVFTDNYNLNVELLIKNLRDIIMKKLSILCITKSSISLSALFVSFSVTLSQSSISISVSDSSASATSVSEILTLTTSAFTASTFSASAASTVIISSLCFKRMLHRL